MKCQRCGSERVIEIVAKCPDGYDASIGKDRYDRPAIDGLCCEGEYVEPKVCLDCGQCQGKWPVALDEEPMGEPEKPDPGFPSVQKWLDAVRGHSCKAKSIVSSDWPGDRTMGYLCEGCGRWFKISLPVVKETLSEVPSDIRKALQTAEGRRNLAATLTGK